ncbi:MAG TPA: class 1 fructose-bisphosphatase [Phycisphaerae bacterium]|nr:class 1 fructose-bisphosphatase [Phycisphaerae bacterium]HNU44504.1 class 1 fructose-bisphosphatase [Phycisphaerae bacterium]
MRTTSEPTSIVTLQQHIIEQQREHPTATGEFSWLLSGITLATEIIQAQVRRAGLLSAAVLGETGTRNVQGEMVQKLDVIANKTICSCLGYRNVGIMVSEEDDEPTIVKEGTRTRKYIVLFDPLDGSSNIDVNVSIGTIFSILQRRDDVKDDDVMAHILQPGCQQLAAGYVVYGSSTVLAYTTGEGVHMFTLDPSIGAYVLSRENVRMPHTGKEYSVNEAYRDTFPDAIQRYLQWVKTAEAGKYSMRYIGSFVADFHRTLLRGGVFLYPPTKSAPGGKLRLMYEANPMAFLAEQAGGAATDGKQRILDKAPKALHERTPLVIGSKAEVDRVLSFWQG